MSLRIQKAWSQIGNPTQPGSHSAPKVGKILDITQEHIDAAQALNGNATVVLEHAESSGMLPQWKIVAINSSPSLVTSSAAHR